MTLIGRKGDGMRKVKGELLRAEWLLYIHIVKSYIMGGGRVRRATGETQKTAGQSYHNPRVFLACAGYRLSPFPA